jgi:hypothetical protein
VDISQGEKVEAELDHMIRRADERRRLSEGERAEHELWMESERQYRAKRQAELVFAWVAYHEEAACRALANGEAIAARHRAQIEALLGPGRMSGENGHRKESNGHHY